MADQESEQRAREWRKDIERNWPYGNLLLFRESIEAAFKAGERRGMERAAQIADHFATDALTKEEYPPNGAANYKDRGDFGYIKKVAECVAAAIRQEKESTKPT